MIIYLWFTFAIYREKNHFRSVKKKKKIHKILPRALIEQVILHVKHIIYIIICFFFRILFIHSKCV